MKGHIDGAINTTLTDILTTADANPADVNGYLIVCYTGQTAGQGAMALKLSGKNDTTIQKYGRWSSTTFLDYIHTQIAHLSKSISTKMSTKFTFTNIANIEKPPNR